ncbi:MAG: tRNA (adenosine(37)-N6)-threonylcarbamoyltransferase complex dimerization subunit type 1 TsaB [Proteobacteria bacterium]|nr:tRNA (adenosine(37)-N6)-threonylcarbamoyltransferase complex dimerization subunit type 1 TsaB [Pseudomonadota bacterium]
MTNILAIDTSTDACSVALYLDGEYREIYELIPRQHSQRIFPMLRELLPSGNLREQGVDAIAYASGPGSFTGLRIAASAVQGLAFGNELPALAVSTLACQAQTALREGVAIPEDRVLSMLDARMNEVYWAAYDFQDGLATLMQGPVVCAPENVDFTTQQERLVGVGGGFGYADFLPGHLQLALVKTRVDLFPRARDLIPQALASYALGDWQQPAEVMPVYVREEVSWKKISEQGKRQ